VRAWIGERSENARDEAGVLRVERGSESEDEDEDEEGAEVLSRSPTPPAPLTPPRRRLRSVRSEAMVNERRVTVVVE
jgi:hypothetical protein